MVSLKGKIALITGGNSGIGLATAKEFVNEGAYVFITGRREPELAAAVKEIGKNVAGVQETRRTLAILIGSSRKSSARRASSILCSLMPEGRSFAPLGKITEEHYDALFKSNVKGVLFTVQKAFRYCRTVRLSS